MEKLSTQTPLDFDDIIQTINYVKYSEYDERRNIVKWKFLNTIMITVINSLK